jgi:signal transduction histidine kinase
MWFDDRADMTSKPPFSAVFVDSSVDSRLVLQEQSVPQDFSILIVEDDEDTRSNLADILSLDGYEIQTESHCLSAITAVENRSFDAVIVDWRLPDSNADELIPIIVKYQPNTPVIVVTGMREFDTAVKALRSGAYDFLLKPINPDALRSVMRRIGERKQHLAEIEAAQNKLLVNERLAAIGQMVTGLAHESRNAFQRSHACLAELALDLTDRPDSLELVRKVQKALDDLHFLLEEVRDYSAPIILERRPCCLESLIHGSWQDILETRQLEIAPRFTLEKGDGVPNNCLVDIKRMQQVMRNLLENAIFACTRQGEVQVRLSLVKGKQSLIRIEVSDDGKGVPVEERETIFAPFYTTKTKGTGLGLAVSRRFIDAHDGRIFLDTNYIGGARFVVELPQYRH